MKTRNLSVYSASMMKSREGRQLFYKTRRQGHFLRYLDKYIRHYVDKYTSKPFTPNLKHGGYVLRSLSLLYALLLAFIFISVHIETKEHQFSSTLNYKTLNQSPHLMTCFCLFSTSHRGIQF